MPDVGKSPRDAAGRFVSADANNDPDLDRSDVAPGPTAEREGYESELKAATALHEAMEKERAQQAIMRLVVTDEEVFTILTVAMMVRFTNGWAEDKLKCSDAPDCMRRLPEILAWLDGACGASTA